MLKRVKEARKNYHKRLFDSNVFSISFEGIASNADSSNTISKKIAKEMLNSIANEQSIDIKPCKKLSG